MKKDDILETKEENFEEPREDEELEQAEDVCDEAESLKEEIDKLKNDYLRALADAENIKRRCAQEIEKNSKYAIAGFAKELLAVADNLQRAIDAAGESLNGTNMENFVKGVEMTQAELAKVFQRYGVSKMEIMGTVFDPNYHRVVQEIEDRSKKPGTIVAEVQTGYMIGDRILREAMVIVTKK